MNGLHDEEKPRHRTACGGYLVIGARANILHVQCGERHGALLEGSKTDRCVWAQRGALRAVACRCVAACRGARAALRPRACMEASLGSSSELPLAASRLLSISGTAGPDWRNFVATLVILAAPIAVYFVLVAPDVGRRISWALVAVTAVTSFTTYAALLITGLKSPGIVPRSEASEMEDMCAAAAPLPSPPDPPDAEQRPAL